MQPVSQAWKDQQLRNLVPESFVEISLKVGDPEVQREADVTDNGHEIMSVLRDIVDGTTKAIKYATLEPFIWNLDGSCDLVGSDEDEYEGFIPQDEETPLVTRIGDELYVMV